MRLYHNLKRDCECSEERTRNRFRVSALEGSYRSCELICARVCDRHELILRVDDLQGFCSNAQRLDRQELLLSVLGYCQGLTSLLGLTHVPELSH